MNKKSFLTLLMIWLSMTSWAIADDNNARKNSCELVLILIDDGGSAAVKKIADMFSWQPEIAEKASNAVSIIKNFKWMEAYVYVLLDLNGLSEKHFIVASTKENGTIYFLLSFEKHKGELLLTNITFNDKYENLFESAAPFPFEPKIISC